MAKVQSNPVERKDLEEQLKIIGGGFGRTGTNSLKAALNQLGYKCYHMKEIWNNGKSEVQKWVKLTNTPQNERNATMWKDLFGAHGYTACVDWPTTIYYKELLKYNPSAKVILSIRDTPDKWYNSTKNTIYQMRKESDSWVFQFIAALIFGIGTACIKEAIWGKSGTFDDKFEDKEYAIEVYNKHIEQVKKHVPKEQLLVFNVKQGWKPLCKFLDINDIPNQSFPRTNSTKDFERQIALIRRVKLVINVVACSLVVGVSFLAYYVNN